jgi:CheY-like chemotaxis protein/signal transduction histidine kinase
LFLSFFPSFSFQPLSAFIHGFEGLKDSLMNSADFLLRMNEAEFPEYHKKLVGSVAFMKTTLESLVGTYQILLMTINRFTDYTKVTHEIPLVPTMESIHLIDSLTAPISCVQDLQNRIRIKVEPIDNAISEFVFTDRQWLQDNILCLVSNAVKFSMKGMVTVRVYISSPPTVPSLVISQPLLMSASHSINSQRKGIFTDIEIGTIRSEELDERSYIQHIRFEVEDEGVGILSSIETLDLSSVEVTSAVFSEPSTAAKGTGNNVGGSGLGLFCLAKRVAALGGEYGVIDKSTLTRPSEGSLFWFSIPFSPDYGNLKQAPIIRCKSHSPGDGKVHDPFSHRWFDHNGEILADACLVPSKTPPSYVDNGSSSLPIENVVNTGLSSLDLLQKKLSAAASLSEEATNKSLSVPPLSNEANNQDVRKQHVLVVDDSLPIVKMLKIMLEKNGFLVSTASNGLEAVNRVQESLDRLTSKVTDGVTGSKNSTPIDAVLMDIQMPIMDGIEATRKIRQIESDSKEPENCIRSGNFNHLIVAMSASSEDETVNSAYKAGADKFIAKPFNLLSFQQIFAEYKERKKTGNYSFSPEIEKE